MPAPTEARSYTPEARAGAVRAMVEGDKVIGISPDKVIAQRARQAISEGKTRQELESLQRQGKGMSDEERKRNIDAIGASNERDASGNKKRDGSATDASTEAGRFAKADKESMNVNLLLKEGVDALKDPEVRTRVFTALELSLKKWGPTAAVIAELRARSNGQALVEQYLETMVKENPKLLTIVQGMEGRLDSSSINISNVPELKAEAKRLSDELTERMSESNAVKDALREYNDPNSAASQKLEQANNDRPNLISTRDAAKDRLENLQGQRSKTDPTNAEQIRILSDQIETHTALLRTAEANLQANQQTLNRRVELETRQQQLKDQISALTQSANKAKEDLHGAEIKRTSQEISYVDGVSNYMEDATDKFVSEMAQEYLDKAQGEYDKMAAEAKDKDEKAFWEKFKNRHITTKEIRKGLFRRKQPHAEWNRKQVAEDFTTLFKDGEEAFFNKAFTQAERDKFLKNPEMRNKIIGEVIKHQNSVYGLTENQRQFLADRFPDAIIKGITENPANQKALEMLRNLDPEGKALNDREYLAKMMAAHKGKTGLIAFLMALLIGVGAAFVAPAAVAIGLGAAVAAGGGVKMGGEAIGNKFG